MDIQIMAELERPELVRALLIEGAATTEEELMTSLSLSGLLGWAEASGIVVTTTLVVAKYKPAAAIRNVEDGVNVNEESLAAFRQFSQEALRNGLSGKLWLIASALSIHNAASGLATWNGNEPVRQRELNERAVAMLKTVPEDRRDGNWWEAYRKPMVGLYEGGHVPWNPFDYMRITRRMVETGCKDAGGRVAFLLQKFGGDMSQMVQAILDHEIGAQNQRDRLARMIIHLNKMVASFAA